MISNEQRERIIELSFYITQSFRTNDYKQIAILREELNSLVNEVLMKAPLYPRNPHYDY